MFMSLNRYIQKMLNILQYKLMVDLADDVNEQLYKEETSLITVQADGEPRC